MKRTIESDISVGVKKRCVRKLIIDLIGDEDKPLESVVESYVEIPMVEIIEENAQGSEKEKEITNSGETPEENTSAGEGADANAGNPEESTSFEESVVIPQLDATQQDLPQFGQQETNYLNGPFPYTGDVEVDLMTINVEYQRIVTEMNASVYRLQQEVLRRASVN